MFCENKFCFFNKIGQCEKIGVEIDISGHCKSCRYIPMTDKEISEIKERHENEVIKQIIKDSIVCQEKI